VLTAQYGLIPCIKQITVSLQKVKLGVCTVACFTSELFLEPWIISRVPLTIQNTPDGHWCALTHTQTERSIQLHFTVVMKAIYDLVTAMHATRIERDLESAS
jgi:hypothetical protein